MKHAILVLIVGASSVPAFARDYFEKKYELQLMPNLGWSNFDGFVVGLDASLSIPLSERWQWKFGGSYEMRKRSSWRAVTTGAVSISPTGIASESAVGTPTVRLYRDIDVRIGLADDGQWSVGVADAEAWVAGRADASAWAPGTRDPEQWTVGQVDA